LRAVGLVYFLLIAGKKINNTIRLLKGEISISVDESFKPVITEQIKVYESSYPEAHIQASYKSEADCFRDLQTDSTRMIIVSRGLNADESKFISKSYHLSHYGMYWHMMQ
jgi:hypothetical protein